jgi:hypothetical protein
MHEQRPDPARTVGMLPRQIATQFSPQLGFALDRSQLVWVGFILLSLAVGAITLAFSFMDGGNADSARFSMTSPSRADFCYSCTSVAAQIDRSLRSGSGAAEWLREAPGSASGPVGPAGAATPSSLSVASHVYVLSACDTTGEALRQAALTTWVKAPVAGAAADAATATTGLRMAWHVHFLMAGTPAECQDSLVRMQPSGLAQRIAGQTPEGSGVTVDVHTSFLLVEHATAAAAGKYTIRAGRFDAGSGGIKASESVLLPLSAHEWDAPAAPDRARFYRHPAFVAAAVALASAITDEGLADAAGAGKAQWDRELITVAFDDVYIDLRALADRMLRLSLPALLEPLASVAPSLKERSDKPSKAAGRGGGLLSSGAAPGILVGRFVTPRSVTNHGGASKNGPAEALDAFRPSRRLLALLSEQKHRAVAAAMELNPFLPIALDDFPFGFVGGGMFTLSRDLARFIRQNAAILDVTTGVPAFRAADEAARARYRSLRLDADPLFVSGETAVGGWLLSVAKFVFHDEGAGIATQWQSDMLRRRPLAGAPPVALELGYGAAVAYQDIHTYRGRLDQALQTAVSKGDAVREAELRGAITNSTRPLETVAREMGSVYSNFARQGCLFSRCCS